MYALNLNEEGRILSATLAEFAAEEMARVKELPEGDISQYIYKNGEFEYSPIPQEETEREPSQLDRIEAQVFFTAMITDTILEG